MTAGMQLVWTGVVLFREYHTYFLRGLSSVFRINFVNNSLQL